MGYQACELYGTVYIGPDDHNEEKLMDISSGDEVIFRYVESVNTYSEIELSGSGTGTIEILLDGDIAGTVQIQNGKQIGHKIQRQPGQYELTLKFSEVDHLEIESLKFYVAE